MQLSFPNHAISDDDIRFRLGNDSIGRINGIVFPS